MKLYTFSATTDLGGDGETYFDVELTDQEAALLEEYGKKSSVYYDGFSVCKELKELYNRVYKIANDILTEELRDYEEFEDDEESENWQADDTYAVEVLFPKEFEDMLIDGEN
jgi:hypothetical protein